MANLIEVDCDKYTLLAQQAGQAIERLSRVDALVNRNDELELENKRLWVAYSKAGMAAKDAISCLWSACQKEEAPPEDAFDSAVVSLRAANDIVDEIIQLEKAE